MTASKTKTERRNERANEVSEVTEVPLFLLKSVRRVNLWLAVSSFPLKVIASHLMRMRHVRSFVLLSSFSAVHVHLGSCEIAAFFANLSK